MIASIADANAALAQIGLCDWVAVGCEGDLAKKGQICLIQVPSGLAAAFVLKLIWQLLSGALSADAQPEQ